MSELDELERALVEASNIWFSQGLHLKLQRLVQIARDGERAKAMLKQRIEEDNPLTEVPPFNGVFGA
jgi:hypothetical protein